MRSPRSPVERPEDGLGMRQPELRRLLSLGKRLLSANSGHSLTVKDVFLYELNEARRAIRFGLFPNLTQLGQGLGTDSPPSYR